MPSPETLAPFIARTLEAIETFYAGHAEWREDFGPPRVGRLALIAHEQRALAGVHALECRCVWPVLSAGDAVVVRWQIGDRTADGPWVRFEELAYQRWEGEHIVHEQFFYAPAQFAAA